MIRNLRRNIRKNRGFTLVELMIVVAIVGILAALAIYGVTRYMKNAKTAEARNSVGQMAKDAAAAYSREKMAPGVMTGGGTSVVSNAVCKTAPTKVPNDQALIAGKKYQSAAAEWAATTEASDTGWKCLKFSMDQPQYYMYSYTSDETAQTFDAVAEGDLDGDASLSKFTLAGKVQDGTVAVSPSIEEADPEE